MRCQRLVRYSSRWPSAFRPAPDVAVAIIPPPGRAPEPVLIGSELRTHNFGAVVSNANRKLTHSYRLRNSEQRRIEIVDLVNRKPCCGELRLSQNVLEPGDEATVDVVLSVRQEFGEIIHETVVLTEPPQSGDIILRTCAKVYPPIQIDEVTPASGSTVLSTGGPKPVEFNVLAYGTATDPVADLDRLALRSELLVKWAGAKSERQLDDGLWLASRRCSAVLDPKGPIGDRKAQILLEIGGRAAYAHTVAWIVVPPVTTRPKVLAVTPGVAKDYLLIAHSHDQEKFRVTRVECGIPGIRGEIPEGEPATSQTVRIRGENVDRQGNTRGAITPRRERSKCR
jgi:hypothetical protein